MYKIVIFVVCLLISLNAVLAQAEDVDNHRKWKNSLKPKGTASSNVTLARNGRTDYTILIPAQPTTMDEKAASDLAKWLNEITGAEFPVVREGLAFKPSGYEISIGQTKLYSKLAAKSKDNLSRCGYRIAVDGRRLFIVGGSQRGVINGVYCLLEEDLGCRWYAPGTQNIPKKKTLRFRPVPRFYVPALEDRRDPYNADTMFDADWSLRNKTLSSWAKVPVEWGGEPGWPGAHTINNYVPPSLFSEHPEYFAEVNGVRNPIQPCLTHPDVLAMTIEKVRAQLQERPDIRVLDISLNDYDAHSYCMCTNCRKIAETEGSYTGTLLQYINAVADAIKDEFPNTKINTLAYLGTVTPPKTIRPRPNVIFWLCTNARWSNMNVFAREIESLDKAFKGWSAIGANLVVWDYPHGFNYLGIDINLPVYQENLKYYIRLGATGVLYQYADAESNYGADHSFMLSWISAKQMWDPSRDTRALVRDFNYGYYGEAAPHMQRYDDMLWEAWGKWRKDTKTNPVDRAFVARGWELMKKAELLAKSDEELMKRIKIAQLPLMHAMASYGPCQDSRELDIDEFERVARMAGMRYISIDGSGPNIDRYFAKVRGLFATDPEKIGFFELSNEWRFAPDPGDTGMEAKWFAPEFDDSTWSAIKSNQGWEDQGAPGYDGYGWYRQRIDVSPDLLTKADLKMLFLGVDEQAWIFINGERAFEHTIKSTGLGVVRLWIKPFMFDPKPLLKAGSNLVAVRVHDSMVMGGIWRPHYLAWGEGLNPDTFEDTLRIKKEAVKQ